MIKIKIEKKRKLKEREKRELCVAWVLRKEKREDNRRKEKGCNRTEIARRELGQE